jgi:ABC-type dipeptide/oligopeptide/nickel transport system ATPase component
MSEQQLAIMLIGRSGSGKSVLAHKLTKNLTRPVVVVNDKTDNPHIKRVDWNELAGLKKTCLIIEDLISMSKQELEAVKKILNFSNHHSKVILLHLVPPPHFYTHFFYLLGQPSNSHLPLLTQHGNVRAFAIFTQSIHFQFEKQR